MKKYNLHVSATPDAGVGNRGILLFIERFWHYES